MNWLFSHTWVSFNERECCCGLVWNLRCVQVSFQDDFKGSMTLLAVCRWEACLQEWQLTFLSYVWKWPGLKICRELTGCPAPTILCPWSAQYPCTVQSHSVRPLLLKEFQATLCACPMALPTGEHQTWIRTRTWVSSADWLITPGTENSALTGSECSVCTCCTTRKMKSETLTSNDFYVGLTSGTENFNSVQCKNQISVWCSALQCLGSCVEYGLVTRNEGN